MFKFFLTERSVNEATDFYIRLIERAILSIGGTSARVFSLKEIKKNDIIVTIEAKDFVKAYFIKRSNKKINWFQGVTPEEALMMFNSQWRKMLWEIFERITLNKSLLNLFVSSAMKQHYITKYSIVGKDSIIIPCYNKHINRSSFFVKDKYNIPSFVYAGNLAAWQCIDQMLKIYKEVENRIPNSKIALLTADQEQAKNLIHKYGIKNFKIAFCKLEDLDEELKQYKYGFIIREDHIVNNVATPTKMNSYLASGIIPVFSNVIDAFKNNIDLEEVIRIESTDSIEQIVFKILDFEKRTVIDPENIFKNYSELFDKYYNNDTYISALAKKLVSL